MSTVGLLEVEPDLAGRLPREECAAARRLVLPARTVVGKNVEVGQLLAREKAFGAFVLDGMLLHRVRMGDRSALRLLGPDDIYCLGPESPTRLVAESRCTAIAGTRLALLDNSILIAAHRWPSLVRLLLTQMAEQSERAATHIAISQLPRVEERLMAMMWLLAERWGYVTEAGTVVPLALTHETLGELIGSRRPTVTLALGKLAQRGALGKDDRGWLIVGSPPEFHGAISKPRAPELLEGAPPNRQVRSSATAVKANRTPARGTSPTAHPSRRSETNSRLPSSFYGQRSAASAAVIFDSGSAATPAGRAAGDQGHLNGRNQLLQNSRGVGVTGTGSSTGGSLCVS